MSVAINVEDLMERLVDEEPIKDIVPEFFNPDSRYIKNITKTINSEESESIASSAYVLKGLQRR